MSNEGKLYTLALGILLSVLMIAFGMFFGYNLRSDHFPDCTKKVDTIIIHDTIKVEKWDTITEQVIRYKLVQVDIHDTIVRNDTLFVELPFTQKHYHEDSVCEIWISGYEPNLDSARIIQKTIVEQHYIPIAEYRNAVGMMIGTSTAAAYYQRSVGNRLHVGAYAGTSYAGSYNIGITAGVRF